MCALVEFLLEFSVLVDGPEYPVSIEALSQAIGEGKKTYSTPPGCRAVLFTRAAAIVISDFAVREEEWKLLLCCLAMFSLT